MKTFEMPVIELEKFSVEDVVTLSNETPLLPFSWEEEKKIKAY